MFLLLFGITAFASDQIPDTDMHAVATEVVALQKFLFSPSDFTAPENDNSIRTSLTTVEEHLDRLRTRVFADQPALRQTVSMLQNQVGDADRFFRENDKSYARYLLESSLQMCIACHTRTASADFVLPEPDLVVAGPMEKADYFFATRQFEKGQAAYAAILDMPKTALSKETIQKAAFACLVYFARVKEDPQGGKAYFAGLAKEKKFSALDRSQFTTWARAFGVWAKAKVGDVKIETEAEMLKRARALLPKVWEKSGTKTMVQNLRASSLLYSILETSGEKSPAKAEALLDLGKIYERIPYQPNFRFGDMYLKACIENYSKQMAAKNCYEALKQAVRRRMHETPQNNDSADEVDLMKWKKLAF